MNDQINKSRLLNFFSKIQNNPRKYAFFGFLSFILGSLIIISFVRNKKNQQIETTVPLISSPSPVITQIFPTISFFPTVQKNISSSLEQCLEEANELIAKWRKGCIGPNCEGADFAIDPRQDCYKKFGVSPSPYLIMTTYQCPIGYVKACQAGFCECLKQ